jgi:hypothetical protein
MSNEREIALEIAKKINAINQSRGHVLRNGFEWDHIMPTEEMASIIEPTIRLLAADPRRPALVEVKQLRDSYYLRGIDASKKCLGAEWRIDHAQFTKEDLKAHKEMAELFGAHKGAAEVIKLVEAALALSGEPPAGITHLYNIKTAYEEIQKVYEGGCAALPNEYLGWNWVHALVDLAGKYQKKTPAEWVRIGIEAAARETERTEGIQVHLSLAEAIRAIDATALVDRAGEEQGK